jgi:23S rRNA (uracil1939-C5)-methyltransferase
MLIRIEKIVYPGKSLARLNGKVIFTDQGLPGETIEILPLKKSKNYIEGRTTKIIDTSPDRKKPLCDHYHTCSPYQYIDYPRQIKIKSEQINEILSRQLKGALPEIIFKKSELIWGYRNKIKLKIINKNNTPCLAYNKPGTINSFVPIDQCFLSPQLTNALLNKFREVLGKTKLSGLNQIMIRQNTAGELLIGLYHSSSLEAVNVALALETIFDSFPLKGAVVVDENKYTKTIIHGNDYLSQTVQDKNFFIGINSFFQVNSTMLDLLASDLQQNLTLNSYAVLADLYCGVGTFSLLLAGKLKKTIAIEADPENFFFLERNIEVNNATNIYPRMCDCKDIIPFLIKDKVNTVIVDPPRKGLHPQICQGLANSPIPEIAYISCDPATLTRDLGILQKSYNIEKIFAYDFFPQTPHIEIMALLRKNKR